MIITGRDNNYNDTTILYTNDGLGDFTAKTGMPFEGITNGSVTFIDMDGDDNQDVLMTGQGGSSFRPTSTIQLYTNSGSGTFTKEEGSLFDSIYNNYIVPSFADIDGDDDQDVLLTASSTAKLYLNDGSNSFTETTPFDGLATVTFTVFADVDNDGDSDVLIRGTDDDGFAVAKRYTNDGSGTLIIEAEAPTEGMFLISSAFTDVDGDGDNDVIDDTDGDGNYEVLINDGANNFTEKTMGVSFVTIEDGAIAFADLDGDSDPDVLLTGRSSSGPTSKLYVNDGLGNFTEDARRLFVGVENGAIAFADVDGDNDPDVLITGESNSDNLVATALLYINEKTPVFTSGNIIAVEVPENNTAAVLTVMATHAESKELTYAIGGGVDSALFNISATGILTFKAAPDHENPSDRNRNNIYKVTVTASDGENKASQIITVTVTDVNDNAPIITSDATASVVEGTTAVLTVIATDADASAVIIYSNSGGADSLRFSINENAGELSLRTAPDFENPIDQGGDNEYVVEITASDGTNSVTQTITITVTNDPEDDPLGLPEAEGVRLYPNPASGHFMLAGTSGRLSRVSLVSTTGKMVRTYPASQDGIYDTSGLSEGIFFVILEGTEGRQQAGRIVIRK